MNNDFEKDFIYLVSDFIAKTSHPLLAYGHIVFC